MSPSPIMDSTALFLFFLWKNFDTDIDIFRCLYQESKLPPLFINEDGEKHTSHTWTGKCVQGTWLWKLNLLLLYHCNTALISVFRQQSWYSSVAYLIFLFCLHSAHNINNLTLSLHCGPASIAPETNLDLLLPQSLSGSRPRPSRQNEVWSYWFGVKILFSLFACGCLVDRFLNMNAKERELLEPQYGRRPFQSDRFF